MFYDNQRQTVVHIIVLLDIVTMVDTLPLDAVILVVVKAFTFAKNDNYIDLIDIFTSCYR